MDEAQVKALIEASLAPAIRGAFQEFRGYFQEQLEPISNRLSEFEVISQAPSVPQEQTRESKKGATDPAYEALTARLAQMEKLEADRQAELRTYKFGNELGSMVGKYDAIHSDLVKEVLSTRYAGKVVEKGGKYYTPSGSTLEEEVASFFGSDAGSHFLKAPQATPGGTKPSTNVSATKATPSVDDMLADMEW